MIEIEAFLAIAEAGSFTAAAAHLHISQPAISRRIDLLETELEAPLFLRTRSGAALTPAGRAFLPFARNAVASLRDGVRAIDDASDSERGELRLAVVGTLASAGLLAGVRRFRQDFPHIRLRLRTANSKEITRLVLSGEVDLGLRYFTADAPFLENTVIATDSLALVAAGDSSLVPPRVTHPGALAGIPWIGFPVGTGSSGEPFAHHLEQTLARWGIDIAERITIDSLTAQKRMIEADFGIGLMLESAIIEERQAGSLVAVAHPFGSATAPIVALRRTDGFRSRAMEALLALIAEPESPAL